MPDRAHSTVSRSPPLSSLCHHSHPHRRHQNHHGTTPTDATHTHPPPQTIPRSSPHHRAVSAEWGRGDVPSDCCRARDNCCQDSLKPLRSLRSEVKGQFTLTIRVKGQFTLMTFNPPIYIQVQYIIHVYVCVICTVHVH